MHVFVEKKKQYQYIAVKKVPYFECVPHLSSHDSYFSSWPGIVGVPTEML